MATVLEELRAIEERDGILNPQAVVDFARNPKTALHKKFEWNDKKAGEQHRLHQARMIINVQVTFLKSKNENVPTMAFVSLKDDRNREGGYRSIATVLTDEELRAKMVDEAKHDFQIFRRRYQELVELSKLFDEIEKVLTR